MFKGLRTVVYHVDDLAKAKQWYSSILEVEPYFDQPFCIGFNVGGFELGLDPNMENISKGTNVDAYWGVADAKTVYERLLQLGAQKHSEPQNVGEGIIVASVRDPFGNVFGHREPSFQAGRMTTSDS
jgi:predicted enzyme related to lactoylglutathione lyase